MKNETQQAITDAYFAGQLAAYDKVHVADNPYQDASYELYRAWVDGWAVEDYKTHGGGSYNRPQDPPPVDSGR
jgi:hypothetical protein